MRLTKKVILNSRMVKEHLTVVIPLGAKERLTATTAMTKPPATAMQKPPQTKERGKPSQKPSKRRRHGEHSKRQLLDEHSDRLAGHVDRHVDLPGC